MEDPRLKLQSAIEDIGAEKAQQAYENLFALGAIELTIPLQASFTNLNWARTELWESLNRGMLDVIPLSFQSNLIEELYNVSVLLDTAKTGGDVRAQITTAIEILFATVWAFGFHHVGAGALNFLQKANDLKELEAENLKLRSNLTEANNSLSAITTELANAKENSKIIDDLAISGKESIDKILDDVTKATTASTDADTLLKKIKDTNTEVVDFRSKAEKASADSKSFADDIKVFGDEVSKYRADMTAATAESKSAIAEGKINISDRIKEFDTETEDTKNKRQAELDELDARFASRESQIKEQLLKATGQTLFHSFDTRKADIIKTKWAWVKITYTLFAITALYVIALAIWLYVDKITEISPAIYLRFSVVLPLASAIWFALAQYAKERRFEEEYAFRSNISVSLVPYRDEVAKLLAVEQTDENTKLADFVIRSIDRVFTMPSELNQKPTDKIEDMVTRFADLPKELVDKLPEILKALNPKGK